MLVGDVWLCSGQSNMSLRLGASLGVAEDIKDADFPQIRQLEIAFRTASSPVSDVTVTGDWTPCSPATAKNFSGVAFYFAREVFRKTQVPIGLIHSSRGGSYIWAWWSPEGLASVPELVNDPESNKFYQLENYRKNLPSALVARENWVKAVHQAVADKSDSSLTPAKQAVMKTNLQVALDAQDAWIKASRAALAGNGDLASPPPADFVRLLAALTDRKDLVVPPVPNGAPDDRTSWYAIYNAMIYPMAPFAIKGALWYQGENNGLDDDIYSLKMRALIGGWRMLWGQGDFPFYFVQLPGYKEPTDDPADSFGWPDIREAQRKSMSIQNTGMAITIDVGDAANIHPTNKYDVGRRLALWALAKDYGLTELVYSGPIYREMKVEDNKVRLLFDYAEAGLMVGKKEGRGEVTEDKNGKLGSFAIAGEDKVWQWAEAMLDGQAVVLWSDKVPKPVAVRYAYSWNPVGASLYNRAGLPACPFRTDNW
ncbi:MAG: hypothetical protein HQL31_05975 [Planctomycetes bacterium]|nr:hypothetical protein [Planctomycetota bacterium]